MANEEIKESVLMVYGPRALRDAIGILERQLECTITYEDPPYRSNAALEQLFDGGPTIPKSHRIMFTIGPGGRAHKLSLIRSLLNQYQQQDQSVQYRVAISPQETNIFHIIPTSITDASGQQVAHNSPLESTIKLENKVGTSFHGVAEQICDVISGKDGNPRVLLGRPPNHEFLTTPASLGGDGTARTLLDRLISEYNRLHEGTVSWTVVRDPSGDFCALTFHLLDTRPVADRALHIESTRPLRDALGFLEQDLGQAITYEDVPYECNCDVLSNMSGEPQIVRGGIFDFSYSHGSDPTQVLSGCLKAYESQSNPGKFSVKQEGGRLHVFPLASKDRKGVWVDRQSLLDTNLSLSVDSKSGSEILKLLCDVLRDRSGQKVVPGEIAPPVPAQELISFSIHEKPARECLTQFLKLVGGDRSWELLFEPSSGGYVLNLRR